MPASSRSPLLRSLSLLCVSLSLLPTSQAACLGMGLFAHRGAPGHPENSRSAVEVAVRGSWEGAEIDVQTLADGGLAVHHDALTTQTLQRTQADDAQEQRSLPLASAIVNALHVVAVGQGYAYPYNEHLRVHYLQGITFGYRPKD